MKILKRSFSENVPENIYDTMLSLARWCAGIEEVAHRPSLKILSQWAKFPVCRSVFLTIWVCILSAKLTKNALHQTVLWCFCPLRYTIIKKKHKHLLG